MANNGTLKNKQHDDTESFDFSDAMMQVGDEAMMLDMINRLIAESRHQTQIAVELTKLVVEKNGAEPLKEAEIFSIYKRAVKVISDSLPIKELQEKISAC